ncbi:MULTISPECIES: hypothetical protein [unclassified Streptomyces]|uniref:hypothetical protein n=1 Tax=unclassified Streptomyces TaxID=2593676 RepID=UPI001F2E5A75|nr:MULTISPECIES: hypothetical protein [unclassified Streptomyces]
MTTFDSVGAAYAAHSDSARGSLRHDLVERRLLAELPAAPRLVAADAELRAAVISAVGGRSLDGAAYPPEKQRRSYGIPKPGGRHRAMPDVEVTAQVLIRLLDDGCATGRCEHAA